MPNTTNTPYTAITAAVATWCATNGFAARSEFLTTGDDSPPPKFVLWRIGAEISKRHADNDERFVEYPFTVYVGLPDTAENRAALFGYHWGVRAALVTAGFIPQDDYEIGIDKEFGCVYLSKEYTKTFKVGEISI